MLMEQKNVLMKLKRKIKHRNVKRTELHWTGNAKLNPSLKLPSAAIAIVHRSDGSGTTFNFTNYLSKVSPDSKSRVGENTAVEWPTGIGAKGNEGVAANVVQTKGSIGYVEYAYAKQNKIPATKLVNAVAPQCRRPFPLSRPRPRTPTGPMPPVITRS